MAVLSRLADGHASVARAINLNSLFVGSEGTLGIVTEATLKLAVTPEHFSVAIVPFDNIRDAVTAAADVIRGGVPVAALELMDEAQMRIINQGGATRPRIWEERPTLFFKFSRTKVTVGDNIESARRIIRHHRPGNFEFARDENEQASLWSARKESLYSLLALRKDGEELCEYKRLRERMPCSLVTCRNYSNFWLLADHP